MLASNLSADKYIFQREIPGGDSEIEGFFKNRMFISS